MLDSILLGITYVAIFMGVCSSAALFVYWILEFNSTDQRIERRVYKLSKYLLLKGSTSDRMREHEIRVYGDNIVNWEEYAP